MSETTLSALVQGQFINGRVTEGSSGQYTSVTNPATGAEIASIQLAGTADVDAAVAAAKAAFGPWSTTIPAERSAVLAKFARLMEERAEDFAQLESAQAGKPIRLAREFDVPGTIDNIDFFSGAARNLEGKATGEYSADHTSSIRREAIGVIGSISPWNYPLQMAAWKVLPAIAAGNTIVLKPAEITPLTTTLFAQIAAQAGLPDGVLNVVVGKGSIVGDYLLRHPDVDMLSFTGSTPVGRTVLDAAATTAKRVHLELGGKAPFVVFEDADLEAAIHGAVAGSLINSGQDCTAATRAIVHRSLYEEFIDGVSKLYAQVKIGDTTDPATDMGPLVSMAHREKVAEMVERARGYARVIGGGIPEGEQFANGSYYLPTLVADATPDSEIFREEVFGPVLAVTPFDTDEEAIELANDTPYGLAASAWTTNVYRANRATREIRSGCVWVNDHIPIISEMPHGGMKQSGFGKDMSTYSLDEYTVIKHVMFDLTGDARKEWHRTIFSVD
ncbi:gamma-aminobutyraldehyde dehydrogenase [Glutamicibacter sp. JL.03c]|uniref:gamma-aminobutyraldehyde dehydrogenase n=1 Tax=Glutamicibacter sp. JL.03c TaxID=2984842 RepID=UPI0021F7DA54|nr:gamma-aminobutyraldehyde dehydrogenase [Glutamicibacter sp. JL.03c]UYQ77298.1 gamma-aminobutyraldehyde dehydrogenase [Glutamicibacter sp. JL.03c]